MLKFQYLRKSTQALSQRQDYRMMDIKGELESDVVDGRGRGDCVRFGFGWGRGFFDGVVRVIIVFHHLVREVVCCLGL
jgi:hypothetical protein